MYHRLKRKDSQPRRISWGKPKFSLRSTLAGLVLFFIIGGSIFMMYRTVEETYQIGINLPEKYNKAMVINMPDYRLSIRPLSAKAAKAEGIEEGVVEKNKKIYRNAYKNTDVEQIIEPNKIKENIIFKEPGHPLEFKYDLGDTSEYIIERSEDGDKYYFYDKEKYSQLNPKSDYYLRERALHRVFTIPAPFITDVEGEMSYSAVQMSIEDNILIVTINEEWIDSHKYPIVLDPTIEINILTLYSIAIPGKNWEVLFNTQGTSTLAISLVTDNRYTTNWGEWPEDDVNTADHLEFLELYGDGQPVEHEKILDADGHIIEIRVDNWEYTEGKLVNKWLIADDHAIKFDFGSETTYAYNAPAGYNKKRSITVTYSGGALASYQVDITFDSATDITAGDMQADCDDMRFYDSDDSTPLDYWMVEDTCNSATTKVWIEIPSITANKTIYMYQDHSTDTYGGNGANTFIIFSDGSNEDGWGADYGYFDIQNSDYHNHTGGAVQHNIYKTISQGSNNWRLVGKVQAGSGNHDAWIGINNTTSALRNTGYGVGVRVTGGDDMTTTYWDNGSETTTTFSDVAPNSNYYKLMITHASEVFKYYLDDVEKKEYTFANWNSNGTYIQIESFGTAYDDYIFVAKFTSSDPTTAVGAKEVVLTADGGACAYGDECDNDLCINAVCRAGGSCSDNAYEGLGCSSDANAYNHATLGGVCLTAGTCDQTDPVAMDCSAAGTASCETGDPTYASCSGRGGDSCDSETGGGSFSQNGTCYSDATSNSCSTSVTVAYDGVYYTTINRLEDYSPSADADGMGCDSTVTGGDYINNGMVIFPLTCATMGAIGQEGSVKWHGGCSNTVGDKCDSSPDYSSLTAPWTADGYCITGGTTCATDIVCYDDNATTYYANCSSCSSANTDIDACISDVTDGGYVANGYCTTGGICSTGIVYDNAGTLTNSCGTAGQACDSDATGAENGAFSTAANGACITGNACDTDEVCYDDANYQADCSSCSSANTDIDACHSDVTSGGYVADGYCTTGGTCSTGVVYDNAGTLTNSCSNGGGQACDADATGAEGGAFSTASNGICVSGSACDGSHVANVSGVYYSCSASADGYQCDTATTGAFSQDSMCLSDTNDGGAYTCQTAGHACFDGTYYEDTCASCSASNGCTSTLTSGGNYAASGICLTDNSCDETSMVCYDSGDSGYKSTCSSCGVTTAEANRCDTDITGGAYSANGVCTDADTCTTGGLYDDEGTLKANCSAGTTTNVDPCESSAADGWSANGMCLGDSSCGTGIVYTNAGTLTTGCSNGGGEACYTDATNDGSITSWSPTGVCTSGSVCTAAALTVLDSGTYYATCTGHTGASCDSGGGATYTQDGICLSSGACDTANPVVMDCGISCAVTDPTYDTCSGYGGDSCDSTATGGDFTQNGMCYDSGTYACLTSGFVFYDGSNYASSTNIATTNYDHDSDADGKGCDSVITSGGDFSVDGMLTSAPACTTSGTVYLATDTNYFTTGCSNGGGQSCDTSITAHLTAPWTSDGICVSGSACESSNVANVSSTYYSCNDSADGYQCDTATTGAFAQDSMCLSDTNSGGAYDCKTSGHACFDGTYYEDTCASCSASNGCTSTLTSGGDFSASGICLTDNNCDETTEAAKDCSYSEADCSNYYSSCASVSDNDRCDTDITDGSFTDTGICFSNSCVAVTAENSGAGNCSDGLDNDGDGIIDLYDTGCNDAPSVPVLVSPANASTITDNSPTLLATYTDSAQAGYTYYRVASADTCTAGSNIIISGNSSKTITTSENTVWTVPMSIGTSGTYYWCAKNYDGYLNSAWTAMGNFILSRHTMDKFQKGTMFEPGGSGLIMEGMTVW